MSRELADVYYSNSAKQSMATPSPSSAKGSHGGEEGEERESFECNICFDTATEAVVSMCGHLFCWPCIHRWMEARTDSPTCPVCKSAIDKSRLIPLYGRGSTNKSDPRERVPPRPQGQRREVPDQDDHDDMRGFNGGINVSFGLGLPMFGMQTFNIQTGRPMHPGRAHHHGNRAEETQQRVVARVMLTLAILFIIMIIFS